MIMKSKDKYRRIVEKLSPLMDSDEKITEALRRMDEQELEELDRKNSYEIPYKYISIVNQITEAVYNGFICFLNPETLEFEQASCKGYYEFVGSEFDELNDDMIDEQGLTYTEWDNYIRFEPFNRNDSLDRIEKFVDYLKNKDLKAQLENLTDKEELYRNFKGIMERTGLLGTWNSFRRKEIENYVKNNLISNLGDDKTTSEDVYSQ